MSIARHARMLDATVPVAFAEHFDRIADAMIGPMIAQAEREHAQLERQFERVMAAMERDVERGMFALERDFGPTNQGEL